MNRKLVAAAAIVATAAAVGWPAAAQAEPPPSNRSLMEYCKNAKKLEGENNGSSSAANGIQPESCSVEEISFTNFWEAPVKATPDIVNCDGTSNMQIIANRTQSFSQGKGKYTLYTPGGGISLVGIVNAGWRQHMGTTEMTERSVTLGSGVFLTIPPGYQAWAEWKPLMGERKYRWKVEFKMDLNGEKIWYVDDVNQGPVLSQTQSMYGPDGSLLPIDDELRKRLNLEGNAQAQWTPRYEACGKAAARSSTGSVRAVGIPPRSDLPPNGSRAWNPQTDGPEPQ